MYPTDDKVVNWFSSSELRMSLYAVLIVEVVLSLYFHMRQYTYIVVHNEVPEIVTSVGRGLYTDLDFTFAQDDTLNKIEHNFGKKLYIITLWMIAIHFNCISAMWDFARDVSFVWPDMISVEIARNMSFAMLCYCSYEILMFPVQYHSWLTEAKRFGRHFHVPQQHIIKYLKKIVTTLTPVGIAAGIFSWAIMVLEKKPVYVQVSAIVSFSFLFVVLYPSFEIWWLIEGTKEQGLYRKTERELQLRTNLQALCDLVGFPSKRLILRKRDSALCTAFYYGFLWFRRILVVYNYRSVRETTRTDPIDSESRYERIYPTIKEIEGIVAHELGHWKYDHSNKSLILWDYTHISTMVLTYWLRSSQIVYKAFGFPMMTMTLQSNIAVGSSTGSIHDGVMCAPGVLIVYFLILRAYYYFFEMLQHVHQHFCEQEADKFAAAHGYEDELSRGLLKIVLDQQTFPCADQWYSYLYNKHPSLVKRLQFLHNYRSSKRHSLKTEN